MGAAQSIPSDVEGVHFATTQPPRNKLTKPRTNSNTTREASCLPSLPPTLSRLSISGNPKSPPVVQYQTVKDQPYGDVLAIGYSNTVVSNDVRQSGLTFMGDRESENLAHIDLPASNLVLGADSALPTIASPMSVTTKMRRRGSMATHSSTNSSASCAQPLNLNSEVLSMGTVRRRSQLLAAPPATATRKPVKSHQQSQKPPGSLSSLDYFALAPQSDTGAGRCTTPSGYSVLGAFKRGSLRIANGAASPAPSSSRASPELLMKTGYFGSDLTLPEVLNTRPASRGKPLMVITDSVISTHEVRLVPQSPIDWGDGDDVKMPGSPFSFIQGPSTYNEDASDSSPESDPSANETLESLRNPIYRPTDSCESLTSITSSAISIGYEYHKILTEQCLDQGSSKRILIDAEIPDMITSMPCGEVEEHHSIIFKEAQKENNKHPRRQIITKIGGESTDSGYSSSGSVDSWKTACSEQYPEPNQTARKSGILINPKDTQIVPSVEAMSMVPEPMSRRKSVVAAIRRRYSQGDLKAFARNSQGTKPPPVPTVPVVEYSKLPWKPLPELKHRRSMITATKNPAPHIGLPEVLPDIQPVPQLPHRAKLERKGAFNLLNVEDYLPLVEQFPIIDHDKHGNIQDPIMRIGVGRALNRGSKITGQDYYQRFSRRQHVGVGMMVS